MDLLKIPVIAGDGHTYENECIKHFLSRVARWPIKGPMGIDIPNANLVLNRNLFDALTTYREENRMASISLLQHSASLPASTVAHTTPPAQRVPQRQPPRTRETLQVRDCFNMSLADIMKHEHFLSNLRKPGLVRILNLLPQHGRQFDIGSSKDDLIDAIVTRSAPALPVAVTKLLNDTTFLDQITVHGLDLIQSSLHWRRK